MIYAPHGSSGYGAAFVTTQGKTVDVGRHRALLVGRRLSLIWPATIDAGAFSPQEFLELKARIGVDTVTVIDRIRGGAAAVVTIIDHRNLSGWNPLAGRTPAGGGPRFLDASALYFSPTSILPSATVNTIGPDRFAKARAVEEGTVSELAAWVALCFGYVGVKIVGLGWERRLDPDGMQLAAALAAVGSRITL